MAKYVVDIDDTICTHEDNYKNAKHFKENIKKINKLYDQGHIIWFQTARGTETGIDWRKTTENQFKRWGVKYHKLLFGKPSADHYIDDKGINSKDFFK
jgi:hypothetical protein